MSWPESIPFSRNSNRPEHKILANFVDNALKTHPIRLKQISFDSINFTLQAHTKNVHLSLKS